MDRSAAHDSHFDSLSFRLPRQQTQCHDDFSSVEEGGSSADDEEETNNSNKRRRCSDHYSTNADNYNNNGGVVDDRRKKRNKKEKDRSNKICELIMTLHSVLEEGGVSVPRATKHVILQETIKYIRELQDFKKKAQLFPTMRRAATNTPILIPPPAPTTTANTIVSSSALGAAPATAAILAAASPPIVSPLTLIPLAVAARRAATQNPHNPIGMSVSLPGTAAPSGLPQPPVLPHPKQVSLENTTQAVADLRGRLLSATPSFLRTTATTLADLKDISIFRFVKAHEMDLAHVKLCRLLAPSSAPVGEMRMHSEIVGFDLSVEVVGDSLGKPSKFLVKLLPMKAGK